VTQEIQEQQELQEQQALKVSRASRAIQETPDLLVQTRLLQDQLGQPDRQDQLALRASKVSKVLLALLVLTQLCLVLLVLLDLLEQPARLGLLDQQVQPELVFLLLELLVKFLAK
jgi:hypothetical protein